MEFNFYAILAAAASTLVVGFIWYHPKVFGTIWMRESGVNMEDGKKPNMGIIFSLVFIFSILISFLMSALVVHQFGAMGMIGGPDLIETAKPSYSAFMADYGTAFRTYKHGALHGFMSGLFLALPLVAINSLFEKRSWKYIMITGFYWVVSFTVMGAIICRWV